MKFTFHKTFLFTLTLIFIACLARPCIAQVSSPVQDITYTFQSDVDGDQVVVSWTINDNVPTSSISGLATRTVAGSTTIDPISVQREGTATVSVPSIFHVTLKYGDSSVLTRDMKRATLTVVGTSRPTSVGRTTQTTYKSDLQLDLDVARQYFSTARDLSKANQDKETIQKDKDSLTALNKILAAYAQKYPRRVIWDATPFNSVVVVKATSTYPSTIKVVASPTQGAGSTVTLPSVSLPALSAKEFPIPGLSPNTQYQITLSDASPPDPKDTLAALTFDPGATKSIPTTNLPASRVRFTGSSLPVNVRNAQIELPLEVIGTEQIKVNFSETPQGRESVIRLNQLIKLKPECQNTSSFVPCTTTVSFTAEEGKAYAINIQPLAPYQTENTGADLPGTFTGLRSVLADTVTVTFGTDGITFSAKSEDNIKLQVVAQSTTPELPRETFDGLQSSKTPSFPIKYTQLPVQPSEGLRLTIGLQADDASKRTQSQTITLKVAPPPAGTDSKIKKELSTFGNAMMAATPGTPSSGSSNTKLSVKSILTTGLGVFLRVLFPVIP